jgi:hypothetical protein
MVQKGDGAAIGFYDRSGNGQANVGDLCEVKIFNCVFFENGTSTPTSSNVGAAVHFDYNMQNYGNKVPIDGVLVNNTFLGNAPAVSLENQNRMWFINNVAVSYDASSSAAPIVKTDFNTTGQTTKAYNNFLIGLKVPAPSREPDFVNGTKGNIISQSISDFANLGLDDYLTKAQAGEPFFVPYLAINSETSPLIDAGLERGQVFFYGEEIIPTVDIRGQARANAEADSGEKPDIGAYEWGNGIVNPPSEIKAKPVSNDLLTIYHTPDEVLIINKSNSPLSLKIIQSDGKVLVTSTVKTVFSLNKKEFTPGVKIVLVNDGKRTITKKVII